MAYIALPTRDSSFVLLANAAPRLPRSSGGTAASSWSLADASPARPLRARSASVFGPSSSSNFNPRGRRVFASVEGNVTVEEAAVSVGSEEAAAGSEEEKVPEAGGAAEGAEAGAAPAKQLQRSNTVRRQAGGAKREITVATEQIVEGAVFTGRVRSIQSYGAFVDFGAFTDGLVHISELSSEYVREVGDVVQLGQEVSVTVKEMKETEGRIRLTMRDRASEAEQQASRSGGESGAGLGGQEDGSGKPMNRGKIAGRGQGNPRAKSRSGEEQKTTKLKKGQELKGTVKNIIRNGAFIEFAEEGEEGFLRGSEITEGGENVAVDSLLTVGQEVTVRVLKIERGKAALTMKPQVDVTSINESINTNVGAGDASNPFATFFRSANLIPESPASVDAQEETAAVEEVSAVQEAPAVEEAAAAEEPAAIQEEPAAAVGEEAPVEETPAVEETAAAVQEAPAVEESPAVAEETPVSVEEPPAVEETTAAVEEPAAVEANPAVEDITAAVEVPAAVEQSAAVEGTTAAVEEPTAVEHSPAVEDTTAAVEEPAAAEETPAVEDTTAAVEEPAAVEASSAVEDATAAVEESPAVEGITAVEELAAAEETPAVVTSTAVQESPAVEEIAAADEAAAVDESPATEAVEGEAAGAVEDSGESAEAEEPRSLSLGEMAEGIGSAVQEVEKVVEAAADLLNIGDKDGAASNEGAEAAGASSTEEEASGGGKSAEASGEGEAEVTQEAVAAPEPEAVSEAAVAEVEEPKAGAVEEAQAGAGEEAKGAGSASSPTAAQVKELREKSGAGMMECKKALVACGNDMEKASEYLRKKGLASAEKKASRIAAEGRVGGYVHSGRIGVLIEVNCETDFVSRGTRFKELVADMGMQVVACPDVKYVSVDDVPGDFVAKEKEIEMGKEDLASKPPQIRERIVEGRVAKRLAELALLEQAYIRDDKVLVKDHVKEAIAKLGEKIQVRRFVRFNLGEGLQKKSVDFAAEVAAQTAAKAEAKPAAEAPKVEEAKKEEEGPKVAVSAATVKQLREATGAGMMDCKKALAACENDVEKATEYLRKKGLASADKKSGRIASEGLIGSYIHDGRIGVLVEVNSETDFVARSTEFKELVANIAMQVAACPQVQYVTVDEVPAEFIEKEKEIESGKEDLAKRPEAIREKIVEGRVAKTLNELALVEQPYIRDDKILVRDYVKQKIAALGENIQVRRFVRFNLGEGIEKRSTDFAAEVASQTGGRA